MHANADAMGFIHQVTPFMERPREATGEPQKGISSLTTMDLVKFMLE